METIINALVNGILVPFVDHVLVPVLSSGIALVVFAAMWVAFGVALIWSQGSIDATWEWVRSLPILIQALVWLLFMPVVVGLWIWETGWPVLLRLGLVAALAAWNILIFLPRAATTAPQP
jgi:hypothetical protein